MAEEYIPAIWEKGALEYRVTCFNGRAEIISVHRRATDNDGILNACGYYDREWNKLPFSTKDTAFEKSALEPIFLNDMIKYAEKLAKGIPFIRVDGYWIGESYIFEGMTLYP